MNGGERARGYVGTPPLSSRPALSAPEPATGRLAPGPGRGQPLIGLAGLTFLVPLFFLLAFGAGGPVASLEVLAPLTTFALPVVAVIAFWWEDWPGSTLRAGWSGLTDTLIALAAGVGLTLLGQAVVAGFDARALFDPDPGAGQVKTFPDTLPVAAGVFTAILQLTLVSEGWPLRRLGRLASGLAALAVAWGVGVAAYLLLVHVEAGGQDGLRDPGGPVPSVVYGAWLSALGAWQLVFFVVLRGWPFTAVRRRAIRLPLANVVVIACAWGFYLFMRHAVGLSGRQVAAACACGIAALLLTAMLFDRWPWTRLSPLPGRIGVVITSIAVAWLMYWALHSYADTVDWGRAHPEDWVSYSALNAVGMGVILHVAIWKRWPVVVGPGAGPRPGARSNDHRPAPDTRG
ncbi:hypothetical protein [Streptomyces sp. SBT349]|uniref:hypothetical protein n=1 Tax=Streptomyces sp. SBT349 TaxID=1580539 RepID=UPI00066AD064|nr:hypothetical protein [Streptomyces sp. SBT349]